MGKIARYGDPGNKRADEAYLRRMWESDGFDLSGVRIPSGAPVIPFPPKGGWELLVKLYAKLGLHRYSLMQGRNLELVDIKIYNRKRLPPSPFYITLDAMDADTGLPELFQVKVCEFALRYLNCRCTISRPHPGATVSENYPGGKTNPSRFFLNHYPSHTFDRGSLPDWPQSDDVFNDASRFYVVNDFEVEEHSWIRLYLELAVAAEGYHPTAVSHLEIVKVVIETDHVVVEPLNANSVTVYIRYENTDPRKVGQGTNYKAIVKRSFEETTEHLLLLGKTFPVENTDGQPPQKLSKTVNENESPLNC